MSTLWKYTDEQRRRAYRTHQFVADTSDKQTKGLVGWWTMSDPGKFNDKDRSNVRRFYSERINGSVPITDKHPRWGQIRTVLFNGTDQYSSTRHQSQINIGALTDSYSYTFWFKSAETSQAMFMAKFDATASSSVDKMPIFCDISSTTPGIVRAAMRDTDGGFRGISSDATTYNDNQWHFVAVIRDAVANTITLIVDDVVKSQADNIDATCANVGKLNFGVLNNDGAFQHYYAGRMTDVRLYNRRLQDVEANDIYRRPWKAVKPLSRLFVIPNRLVADEGTPFTDSDKTGQSTWNSSTSITVNDGELLVVIYVTDNDSSSDGNTSLHSTVAIDGQSMTKAREYTNSEGAGNAGSTVSVWYLVADGAIASSSVVATVLSTGKTAKAITSRVFTIPAGKVVTVDGVQDGGTSGADPESLTATGATDDLHLWVRGIGLEDDVGDVGTMVPTSGWTTFDEDGTTGAASASNQTVTGEFKTTVSGTTSGASDPSVDSTPDTASVLVGLLIATAAEVTTIPRMMLMGVG